MEDNRSNPSSFREEFLEEEINIRQILEQYLRHYLWYIFSILMFGATGYMYLKYAQPVYQATGSILIEKENKSIMGDFSGIEELFGGGNKVVDDQTLVIKSTPVLQKVIEKLGLDVTFQTKTKYLRKTIELYGNDNPLVIEKTTLAEFVEPVVLNIEILDDKVFNLTYNDKVKQFAFGSKLKVGDFISFKINMKDALAFSDMENTSYTITIKPLRNTILALQENLTVGPAVKSAKTSNAIALSTESPSEEKAKDIINEVINEYFNNDIFYKQTVSEKTYKFIQDRLAIMSEELSGVEANIEQYKASNQVYDIATESKAFVDNNLDNKEALRNAELQLNIIDMMLQEMSGKNDILPVNIGLSDPNIGNNIRVYNDLVLQEMQYKNSVGELNPERIVLTKNINSMRENIKASLNNLKRNNQMLVTNLEKQDKTLERELRLIPSKERVIRDISRQQQTKEALYLFLLQRREEVAIGAISIKPDAKVISPAFSSGIPVSPQKMKILLIFLVIGFLIPTAIIYILDLLDTKIHNVADLESLSNIPVLSSIFKANKPELQILDKNDRGNMTESFRILVTNLVFSLSHISDNKNKTILLTSTVAGEGKTYISSNLAAFLAYSSYKVVLLGMDFRAPKLNTYFENYQTKGITHFIKEEDLTLDDIINHTPIAGLDVVFPGLIAPVFLDITKSKRLDLLMAELKAAYDYVIIDSAPVGLVSETLSFAPYVDMCLFVVRANHLDKRMLKISDKLYKEKRFADYRLILNGIDHKRSEYGYGYGYGYGPVEENIKPWHLKYWKEKFK
jgi:capsular exopolysaccharide synthesis family protein